MTWVLVWTLLVVGAVAVLGLLGLRLWRQAKALTLELGAASERLTEVSTRLADLTSAVEDAAGRAPGPSGGTPQNVGPARVRGVRSH